MSEKQNIIITAESCKTCGGHDLVVARNYPCLPPFKEHRVFNPETSKHDFVGHIIKNEMVHCRTCKKAGRPASDYIKYRRHIDPTAAHESALADAIAAAEAADTRAKCITADSELSAQQAEEATATAADLAAKAEAMKTPPWEQEEDNESNDGPPADTTTDNTPDAGPQADTTPPPPKELTADEKKAEKAKAKKAAAEKKKSDKEAKSSGKNGAMFDGQ